MTTSLMTAEQFTARRAAWNEKLILQAPARKNLAEARDRLSINSTFQDAVAGIALLLTWHGEDIVNQAAFDAEVQRAMRAANHMATLCEVERDHTNWGVDRDASLGAHTLSDGTVIRMLMFAADKNSLADWFFVPAMHAAALVKFNEFE